MAKELKRIRALQEARDSKNKDKKDKKKKSEEEAAEEEMGLQGASADDQVQMRLPVDRLKSCLTAV